MRYYLDTNILVYMRRSQYDELSAESKELIDDYGNTLYTSAVCVQEFIHLIQIGKVSSTRHSVQFEAKQIVPWLQTIGVKIVPVNESHLQMLSELPLYADHRDPNDRLIIAQAIADRTTLVSSDHKFRLYEKSGLKFFFNKR